MHSHVLRPQCLTATQSGECLLDPIPAPDGAVVAHADEDAAVARHVRLTDRGDALSVLQDGEPAHE